MKRITVKVTPKVHKKLVKKQYKIFIKTGNRVSFNEIIDKGVKL